MIDLETAENGSSLGFTITGMRFKGTKYIVTKGGTMQNLQIIWKGNDEPSEDYLSAILERSRLSVQIWEEKQELAREKEMEAPNMTVYKCIRIVAP
ncbi:MAG: hypothetical protein ACXACI_00475 [Candidatus Hodarchaeales archaeon]